MRIKKINQSAGIIGNVVDNLSSTSSIDALSANQGKIINEKFNNYKLKLFSDPSDFGLENYTSIAEICAAMPSNSILLFTGNNAQPFTDFIAMSYGTVFIIKQGAYRCVVEITGSETNTQKQRWTTIWRTDMGLGVWQKMQVDNQSFVGKYTFTDQGILLECTTDLTQGDKYTLTVTGSSNTTTTPIHSILRVFQSQAVFKQEGAIHHGYELTGITSQRKSTYTGYIHIPLPQYSTIQVQAPSWVSIKISNAAMVAAIEEGE